MPPTLLRKRLPPKSRRLHARKGQQNLRRACSLPCPLCHSLLAPLLTGGCPTDSGRLDTQQERRLKTRADSPFTTAVAAAAAHLAAEAKQRARAAAAAAAAAAPVTAAEAAGEATAASSSPAEGGGDLARAGAGSRCAAAAGGSCAAADGGAGAAAGARASREASGSAAAAAAAAAPAPLFFGRPAQQLLQEVDAAAARVGQVLLPRLRSEPSFRQLQVSDEHSCTREAGGA